MKLLLASDHAGFELKEKIKERLTKEGYIIEDVGPTEHDPGDDYPDCIAPAARLVSESPGELKAIIFGKSGQGEAMVANRFKNVRATVFYGGPEKIIRLSREHNDANVLSLAAGFLDEREALLAIKKWLDTDFSGDERHKRRILKIEKTHD